MKTLFPPFAVLACCYALFFAYLHATYDSLPPRVATHFDLYGHPNGWMSRDGTMEFSLGMGILVPAFIVGSMAFTGHIPVSFVNLPNRDYWLAPERRKGTSAILLRFGLWFACMTVLFIMGVHWLIVQANTIQGNHHMNGIGTALVLGGFLLGTAIWSGLLIFRFRRIPES